MYNSPTPSQLHSFSYESTRCANPALELSPWPYTHIPPSDFLLLGFICSLLKPIIHTDVNEFHPSCPAEFSKLDQTFLIYEKYIFARPNYMKRLHGLPKSLECETEIT
jgi:hypothetical protein